MIDNCQDARRFMDRYVLQAMVDGATGYGMHEVYFPIRRFTNDWFSSEVVRGLLRDLADRGYCRFRRGLFNEDGEVAGAGYGITERGLAYYRELGAEV